MTCRSHISEPEGSADCAIVSVEANTGTPLKGDFERMARRRFQNPKPERRGKWWTLQYWQDVFSGGKHKRMHKRVRLAPASVPEREVLKIAQEFLRPLNQGMELIGSATNFQHYVLTTYIPVTMRLMAKSTQDRYQSVLDLYLLPTFGDLCLRDVTRLNIERYLTDPSLTALSHESRDKIRDVLSSILRSAVD